MYKYLFLMLLLFCGCKHAGDELRAKKLQDTLAKLKLRIDFRPLSQADAYTFLNDYYLPHLDSLSTKRRLYIHPLLGTNYKKMFIYAKKEIEAKYSDDSLKIIPPEVVLVPPPPEIYNKSFTWDERKLHNTLLIADGKSYLLKAGIPNFKTKKLRHNAFDYGYMSISYPLYNAHTNKLTITERLEIITDCGTGRESIYWFAKTTTGWKKL